MRENYLQYSADENSSHDTCEISLNDGKEEINVPLAMWNVDFYLLHIFISCSAGEVIQGFGILDKYSVTDLYPKLHCNVLKLWFTRGLQCH